MPILLAHSDLDSGDVVPVVAIVFTFLWLTVKALMAPLTQRAKLKARRDESQQGALSDEEHAALENLQRTLSNMERRVESLETILIETQRAKENYGTKL
jgi:TolA-binding protein